MKKLLKLTSVLTMLCSTGFAAELPELQALTQQQVQPNLTTILPTDLISHIKTFTDSSDLAFVNKECLKASLLIATQAYAHAIIHHQPVPEEVMAILRRAHHVLDNTAPDIETQITAQRQQLTTDILNNIDKLSCGSFYSTNLPPFLSQFFQSSLEIFSEYPAPVVLNILGGHQYVGSDKVEAWRSQNLQSIATAASAYISLNDALQGHITDQHTHVFADYRAVRNNTNLETLFAERQDLTLVIDFDNLTQTPDSYGDNSQRNLRRIPHSIQCISITGAKLNVVGDAFLFDANITSLILPNTLKSVKNSFLSDCANITSLVLPNGITSVGAWFMSGCANISSLRLPNGIKSVGAMFLRNCIKLESIILPDSLTTVESEFMSGCTNITSLRLPNGLTSVGDRFLANCTSLTSLRLPNGLTSVRDGFLANCPRLTSLTLSNGITSVGQLFLAHCTSLASLVLPHGLNTVDYNFLAHCTSLTSLTLPNGLTNVRGWFLFGCDSLTDVYATQAVWDRISPQLSELERIRFEQLMHIVE